jgi:two-component system C4-dicarboxylate transport response regulator DctD
MSTILFADDEEHLRLAAGQTFQLADLSVQLFDGAKKLLTHVDRGFDGVIVTDIRMPEMDGIELLKRVQAIDSGFPVILVTGHGDVELAVDCMRLGAYDFIEKPYDPTRLVETVRRALEKRQLTLENRDLRSTLAAQTNSRIQLSGHSQLIESVRKQLLTLAGLETDVLLIGETGTGKDVAAQMVHGASARSDRPFVHINCAALPSDLVEIELFGHEIGAFPSAVRSRFGKFEHARGGTVFLDEIETLPLEVQAKLLHAVQDRKITRLGSNDPIELDIRFIAAAKSDLRAAIEAGKFRSDLYFRLAGAEVRLPTLDERREDIPRLFAELIARAAANHDRETPEVPDNVYSLLAARRWPGNVRELQNVAERFVLGLDLELSAVYQAGAQAQTLPDQLLNHERALIAASLAANGGRLNQTYEALGISRKSLYEKMQRHGLNREDFSDE